MLLPVKRFLLARKTVLWLIASLLLLVFSGVLIPQRLLYGPGNFGGWQKEYPTLLSIVKFLGLDHVFTSPLFLAVSGIFLLSISLTTWDQIRLAVKRTWGAGHLPVNLTNITGITSEKILNEIRKKGYLWQRQTGEQYRLIKHPWGFWGNALLHSGIVVVIAGSILIALTQQHGKINLTVGEKLPAGNPFPYQENGFLAKNFTLPFAIRLDSVKPRFYENDDTKNLISSLTLSGPGEKVSKHTVGINRIVTHGGIRIYQKQQLGNSFYINLHDSKGEVKRLRLDIPYPGNRDKPAYGDFLFAEIPYPVKAKYLADAARQSMYDLNPILTLRLIEGRSIIGELGLRLHQEGKLGPYRATLIDIKRWTTLICVRIHGIPLVFLGFFFIILGAFLVYCMPPREFYVQRQDDKLCVGWLPGRFADLYRDEYDQIMKLQYHDNTEQ